MLRRAGLKPLRALYCGIEISEANMGMGRLQLCSGPACKQGNGRTGCQDTVRGQDLFAMACHGMLCCVLYRLSRHAVLWFCCRYPWSCYIIKPKAFSEWIGFAQMNCPNSMYSSTFLWQPNKASVKKRLNDYLRAATEDPNSKFLLIHLKVLA